MIVSAVLASLAAAPVAAQAQDPGSGVDQYQENVPGAGGDQPGGDNGGGGGGGHNGGGHNTQAGGGSAGGGGGGGGGSALSPSVTDELNAQGADGAATAAIAESTAPQGSGSGSNASGGSGGGGSGSGGSGSSGTNLSAGNGGGGGLGGVVDEILGRNSSDSDGLGVALPIILLATALGAVAFFLARRRRPNEPGSA